jgi:peptidyl-prolyl cis-trans isomerase C
MKSARLSLRWSHAAPAMALAAALLCGCHKKSAAPGGSPVLARAGDEVITVEDLQREAERRLAKNVPVPDKAVLLEEMTQRLAAVSRAKKAKLDADAETKREMENVLIAKLRAQELEAKLAAVSVTDEELRQAFDAGAQKYSRPAKVRLAILHLKGEPKMSEAKRAELRARMEDALKKAIENPAEGGRGAAAGGFGQVAADYSEDQVSRYRGGDIGWLDEGNVSYRWPKAVLEAGYSLEKGARSGVIETDTGLFAVMKTDSRDGATASFDEVKTSLRRELLTKKRSDIEAAFLKETQELTGAEIHTEVLATVTLPTSAAPPPLTEATPPQLPGMKPPPSGN